MGAKVITGDCLDVLPTLAECSVDAVVTDPPYHLTTGKRGGTGVASDNPNSPAGRSRIGTGFMGKAWDGGDVAFRPETWAQIMRVAKPGAHLVAFGGTRTHHRLMVAIEDAGWEIRDALGWLFGSGFPKSHNGPWGGTALKPAWEPIILARKPLAGTVEATVAKFGTGALNIDDSRIGVGADVGRWPANILHDGSDEVLSVFPESDGQLCDISTDPTSRRNQNVYGNLRRGRDGEPSAERRYTEEGGTNFAALPGARRGDSGSAARFFYCAKADRTDRNAGTEQMPKRPLNWSSGAQSPGTFQSENTDRSASNHHPTVKPTELMRYLCRLIAPAGGLILDPFAGSGSTGKAALLEGFDFLGIELDPEYAAIAQARIYATAPLFA